MNSTDVTFVMEHIKHSQAGQRNHTNKVQLRSNMMQKFILQGPMQFATDFWKEYCKNEKCFPELTK